MSNKENELKKIFVDFYRVKRSLNYIRQYDEEEAWRRLQRAIAWKHQRRRIIFSSSVAATVLISFVILYLWRGMDVQQEENILVDYRGGIERDRSTAVVLSLSDGSRVDLSTSDGHVMSGTGIVNHKESRRLEYISHEEQDKDSCFNRLDVSRGAEYHLILSDGTEVWMNSASSLEYPVAFGDTREVRLEGEAYFEVKHDERRPFIVRAGKVAVKVLGTEFNVNTRNEQTVLVKGRVQIDAGKNGKMELQPGEMAEMDGNQLRMSKVNVRKYTAWRHGEFYFDNVCLEEIMKELGDWYDIQSFFMNRSLRECRFSGVLERSETIDKVLRKIEQTTSVHFTLRENTIIVE